MTLKGIMHPVSKHLYLLETTTKIWMKIDLYCHRQRCSFWQYKVYADIRGEFPGEWTSNNSGIIENVDFRGFRMVCHRHLRKRGQHYYVVLFSPLSPFHWPQNTRPWMTSRSWISFYVKFSLLRTAFPQLGYIYCRICLHTAWPAEMCGVRTRTVIRIISGIREKKLRIFRRRYIVGTLTNKANISI